MSDLVYQNYSNKCKGWVNPSTISFGPQITSLSSYNSPAGSTSIITINGTNFYSYSRIAFGTLNPTVYFVNSNILQFYIPNNLPYGIYTIQVFNGAIGSNIVNYTLDGTGGLTKTEADALYLSKVNTDTSIAPLTTFNGNIEVGATATFKSRIFLYDVNSPYKNYGQLVMGTKGMNYSAFSYNGNPTRHQFYTTSDGVNESSTVLIEDTQSTFNVPVNAKSGLTVGINGNSGLNLKVLQQAYFYNVNNQPDQYTDYGRILNAGEAMLYHAYSPIRGLSTSHRFYSAVDGQDGPIKHLSFETGEALTKILNTLEYRQTKFFNKVKTISTNTTLDFPLEETCMITAGVTIYLPEINSPNQVGMTFIFRKTTGNSVDLKVQGLNKIMVSSSVALTDTTFLVSATSVNYVILENNGVYIWAEY